MSFLKNHRNIVAVTGAGGDDVANTQHHFIQLEHILKCLKILHECLEEGQPNGHAGGNGGQRPLVPMPPTRLKRLREDSGGEQRGLVATGVNGSIDDDDKSIPEQVEEAVNESILVWYNYIVEKMPAQSPTDCGIDIKNTMQLVRLILSDLKEGGPCQTLQALFTRELGIDYCSIAYAIYDQNVSN